MRASQRVSFIVPLEPRTTKRRWVMAAILLVTFLTAIEGTVLNTALPVIVGELGGWDSMSWVVSIYLLTTAIVTPISGNLADRFGRKPVLLIGIGLFLFGTLLCGFADSMGQLIFFRALQGLGSGFIVPITFTIVADIYPFELRARAQGWISTVWGASAVISPFTGGLIVDYVSWRWIFFAGIPIGLLAIVLMWRFFFESERKQQHSISIPSIVLFVMAIACFMYGLNGAGTDVDTASWTSIPRSIYLSAAFICFLLFLRIDNRSQSPLIPLRFMRNPAILVPNTADFLLNGILVAINFYIPLWVQGIHGIGAVGSGLILLAMSVAWPISAGASGMLIKRFGMRTVSLLGHIMIAIASFGLIFQDLRMSLGILVGLLTIMGFGFGVTFTVHIVSVQSSVQWQERGRAIASNNLMRQMGQAIGISTLGVMLSSKVAVLLGQRTESEAVGLSMDDLFHSAALSELSDSSIHLLRQVLAMGMQPIFLVLIVLAVLSLLSSLRLPRAITEQ